MVLAFLMMIELQPGMKISRSEIGISLVLVTNG